MAFKTILFYFHLDGQGVNPKSWKQEDPFTPVLKEQNEKGEWNEISWANIDEKINDAFMPLATWWENLILTTVPIGSFNVPFVVILLVVGATFFTIYFI